MSSMCTGLPRMTMVPWTTLWLQLGASVAEPFVQPSSAFVGDAEAETDLSVAALAGEPLGGAGQLRGDAASAEALGDEDILDFRDSQGRVDPGDVGMAHRGARLPRHEIRLCEVEA